MTCEARVILTQRVSMRDGVELACDVYLPPAGKRPYPVILMLSPYDATSGRNASALQWVARGFAYVTADCRGRFKSGGEFTPWVNEVADAHDLLGWIAAQAWCNGRVGMVGGSYCGFTQLAAAAGVHPALKAAAPSAIQADIYSTYYTGGVPVLTFMPSWHISMTARGREPKVPPDWPGLQWRTPLSRLDDHAGIRCPSWKAVAAHGQRDAFWRARSLTGRLKESKAALFLQAGWFDHITVKVFDLFNELTGNPGVARALLRKHACLRVGPWNHGVNMLEGEVDYGPTARVTEAQEVDFLSALLRGKKPATAKHPTPLQIFVMGRNEWRFENEWPLQRTQWTPFYLGSDGHANGAKGDGWLSRDPVGTAACPPDVFTSDPTNPVPTCGGRGVGQGQRNQSEIEKRSDVLVYTLPALTEDLEVTGPIRMRLFAASSARDSDFAVKLVDVYPDGRPFNVCDGILRARFRDGVDQKPRLLKPGTVTELVIDVDETAYCFKRGHRIRVEIAGSNFPRYARNPQTGHRVDTDPELQKATQTIYHSSQYPSHLILPVIPAKN